MSSSEIPSEISAESSPPSLEHLSSMSARALLLPFILNFASISPPSESQREVMVLVNSRIGSITFIEGSFNDQIDMVLFKDGPLPASRSSIDSLRVIKVVEEIECAICLSELKLGEDAKEMTCGHKYHLQCVDKWLRINGSCPICRYKLPVDEDDKEEVKEVSEGESGEERRSRAPIIFHVFFGRDVDVHSDSDMNLNSSVQGESQEMSFRINVHSDSDSNSGSNEQRDGDESMAQDMDIVRD